MKKEKDYVLNSEMLKALGHPTRLRITEGLMNAKDEESSVMDIVKSLNLPQATISQHLKILKGSGIIEGERRGTKIMYRVKSDKVKELIRILM